MNVLLLTHYYWPEIGSPQVLHLDWVRRFCTWGHRVVVVTGFPNYPDGVVQDGYRGRLLMREQHDGATILRTPTLAARNIGTARRLANHLSVAASSWLAMPAAGPIDVIVSEYPPLFTALSGLALSRLWRVPHVLYAADLWVEVAIEMGAIPPGFAARLALGASTLCARSSERTIVTSPGCIEKLEAAGVSRDRLFCIPNSVDTAVFSPDQARRNQVRAARGWSDKTVCLYHGTHGMSQGLAQVLEAAAMVRADRSLRFVFVGDGAEKQALRHAATQLQLDNIEFHPPLPFEQMPGVIDAADIGVVPLKALTAFATTLPSKLFEFMAMAKPVTLAVEGDGRAIVDSAGAGICVPPEAPRELAAAITTLSGNPALRTAMGTRGRTAAARYSRQRTATDLESILQEVLREARATQLEARDASGAG